MDIKLTGHESADELIKQLVYLRVGARRLLRSQRRLREASTRVAGQAAVTTPLKTGQDEALLQIEFAVIEIGRYLSPLCTALDTKATREAIFDALEVNASDRDSDLMRRYGDKTLHVISVLDLENSATRADDIDIKPLKWCQTMAFMNALGTNTKLDRIVHNAANEFFNGAFGEYRERPLMERLTGRSV